MKHESQSPCRALITLSLAGLLAAPLAALAQPPADGPATGLDRYLTRRATDCPEVTYGVTGHLPRLIEADEPDTVRALVDLWRDTCPTMEIAIRTEVLTRIWDGTFDEADCDEELMSALDWFIEYLDWLEDEDSDPVMIWDDWSIRGIPPEEITAFDGFLFSMAEQLIPHTEPGTVANLLARFYAGEVEDVHAELREPAYDGTRLQAMHLEELAGLARVDRLFWGAYTGMWHPTGTLEKAGVKALIGFQCGWQRERVALQAVLAFSIGGMEDDILVEDDGLLIWAERFDLVYLGLEPAYTLVDRRDVQLDLLGAVGGLIGYYEDLEGSATQAPNLASLVLGLGLGIRRPLGAQGNRSLGLELRHDWLDYDAGPGGSDLSGDAWSLRIVFTSAVRDWRSERLAELGMDRWDLNP
jgi:hypothetical protein